ncbi:DNA/RNA-binding protein Alba-like protein [Raphanus sativus]|nr:DNA/RNA-binding protein Alba-like protein [Raphanus sativus]
MKDRQNVHFHVFLLKTKEPLTQFHKPCYTQTERIHWKTFKPAASNYSRIELTVGFKSQGFVSESHPQHATFCFRIQSPLLCSRWTSHPRPGIHRLSGSVLYQTGRKNRIQVSNTKKPSFFYDNLAKKTEKKNTVKHGGSIHKLLMDKKRGSKKIIGVKTKVEKQLTCDCYFEESEAEMQYKKPDDHQSDADSVDDDSKEKFSELIKRLIAQTQKDSDKVENCKSLVDASQFLDSKQGSFWDIAYGHQKYSDEGREVSDEDGYMRGSDARIEWERREDYCFFQHRSHLSISERSMYPTAYKFDPYTRIKTGKGIRVGVVQTRINIVT